MRVAAVARGRRIRTPVLVRPGVFTGLVEEVGTLRRFENRGPSARLTVDCRRVKEDAELGDSIAVNGVCLTVVDRPDGGLVFDAVEETLRRTSLTELRQGANLNLERAVAVGDRLGGHIVQGHVDGTGHFKGKRKSGNGHEFRFDTEPKLLRYIVPKGSIAVDGISLTVVHVDAKGFTVWIVPHTLDNTNLGTKKEGERVNLETDVLAKYVEKLLKTDGAGVDIGKLASTGFLEA